MATRGAVAVGGGGAVVATRGAVAVAGPNGVAVVARPLAGTYIRTIPVGYRTVVYGGYSCYYVGGIYYRPEFYEGTTVYVVVD